MKFFINNNNTTYNYSYYATRPKWLVEAFLKKSLKEFRTNSLYLKKSFPIHNITFAPPFVPCFDPSQLKNEIENPTVGLKMIKASPLKNVGHLFQTKELLCWTSDLSFFNLRGYFLNILKVLQICRFAVRNNRKILFIKGSHSSNGQGKLLNPWLLQYGRNTVPITLRNLFNKSYLNPTHPLLSPQILCLKKNKSCLEEKNFFKMVNFVKYLNKVKEKNTPEDSQNNQISPYYRRYYQLSALLNNCFHLNFGENCSYKTSHFKNQKPSLKRPTAVPKEMLRIYPSKRSDHMGEQKKTHLLLDPYLEHLNYVSLQVKQSLKKKSTYEFELPPKKVAIRVGNIIKLWIKGIQMISQQTAAGLTIPLAGFLTNSKTTFNTIYNLSNDDFYNSINLKSSSLFNRSVSQITINRLENTHFEKSGDLFSQPSEVIKTRTRRLNALGRRKDKDGLFYLPRVSVKSLKYINHERTYRRQKDHLSTLAFSFPKVFPKVFQTATFFIPFFKNDPTVILKKGKRKKKQFTQYISNVNMVFTPKNQRIQDFDQKGWWIDYSNIYNYLPLDKVSYPEANVFFKDSESITNKEKTNKSKLLEYCFFGDIFTWQLKSQKSSSMFYLISKNKENIMTYLKKQAILEKREPIVLKKKKLPFFTHLKKQLEGFKNLELRLKGPYKHLAFLSKDKNKQRQTIGFFLKKRQFLSTLGKFIVFYFNNNNISFKNQVSFPKVKKNQTYIRLPSFPTIKTKVKIALNSECFFLKKYCYKPTYGYNLPLHSPEPTFQRVKKPLRPSVFKVLTKDFKKTVIFKEHNNNTKRKTKEGRSYVTYSKGIFTQKNQRHLNKTLPQKKCRLRPLSFYKYYKTIIALNHLNQYKMFAKTPFVNNQLADIVFFINPEKTQNLVNQANSLKIPTVGIVSGNMAISSNQGHQGYNNFRLKESVYYPILGNPASSFFTLAMISLIVKFLRVEKSKNK